MIKLSKSSKMPCKSWSLEAIDTCPGARENGKLVEACSTCYATKGNYSWPNVVAAREHNKEDWQRDEWADDMVEALAKQSYFRWFDSGDVYHVDLANKILDVMKRTPHVKHWLPTRMYKFPKFLKVLKKMNKLDNVNVRLSSDSVYGKLLIVKDFSTSTIIKKDVIAVDSNVQMCHAPDNAGKCGDCRACWDKDVDVIGYRWH